MPAQTVPPRSGSTAPAQRCTSATSRASFSGMRGCKRASGCEVTSSRGDRNRLRPAYVIQIGYCGSDVAAATTNESPSTRMLDSPSMREVTGCSEGRARWPWCPLVRGNPDTSSQRLRCVRRLGWRRLHAEQSLDGDGERLGNGSSRRPPQREDHQSRKGRHMAMERCRPSSSMRQPPVPSVSSRTDPKRRRVGAL